MPGPAPKKDSERRRRNAPMANTVKLPAAGRKGTTPRWPLSGRTPKGWVGLWKKPQAVMWERNGDELLVARYLKLRNMVQDPVDISDVKPTVLGELRQMEDRLGLSPMALLRLRWEIVEEGPEVVSSPRPRRSRRGRLRVVGEEAIG